MNIIKTYLLSLVEAAANENEENILKFLPHKSDSIYLDLGCDDGKKTMERSMQIHTKKVYGIEISKHQATIAIKKGVKTYISDLNTKFPVKSNSVDVITSNQVIEHLDDTDLFLSEIVRVLKKNGELVLSTENLASWHNIFSLIFGFQPFSMCNFSIKGSIGNPFSLWRTEGKYQTNRYSWLHKRLFSYYGLLDLLSKYKLKVTHIRTAGYYPFPNFMAHIDKIHGHWITIKATKE